ncbi:MAG: S24/S26 family peptidase [Clostridia bacterium]|nr:S24/S26 family peptidase [Clostridia bacterium]
MTSPEALLKEQGFYAAAVHGVSMEPLLCNHRDTVFIEPFDTLKKRDVVLYRRDSGQLVLHRLLSQSGDTCIVCGDNDFVRETIRVSQILGVMTAFTRKGRTVRVTSKRYRLYSRLWNASMPTKRALHRIRRIGRRFR